MDMGSPTVELCAVVIGQVDARLPRELLDLVDPLIPQLLVELEPLGYVVDGCAPREESAEGSSVFESHPSTLPLIW